MGYTVKDLLESKKFSEMQLISDETGVNREIVGARIIEVPDMENFLKGGELLLTIMKAYDNTDEPAFLHHLEELDKKQISGFVVKDPKRTEHSKKLFEVLLQFSKERHLPVMEIPGDLYFWGIIKHIILQLYDIETAELLYFKMTHDNLSNILLNVADSREAIESVLFMTDTMLGNPVSLWNGDGECLFTSNSDKIWGSILNQNISEYKPNIITKYQYWCRRRKDVDYVEYIKKLDVFQRREIYLVISEKHEPLKELDFIALENIIITLQNSLMRLIIEEDLEKRYRRDLEYRLLNGSLSNDEEKEVAGILHFEDTDKFQVVTFRMETLENSETFSNAQIKETEQVEKELLKHLPKGYIFSQTNQIVYIHKVAEQENGLEFRKKLEELQLTIQEYLIRKKVEVNFLVGIGKIVTGYHPLKESFKSSKIALNYIKIIRRIVGDEDKAIIDSSKIGFFYHVMEKMKDKSELRGFIPESLNKLYQYDVQKNGELINTLECFLNNNQSLKKTSEILFVHYRTVSYRLQKITEITNMDFNNATEMLGIRNGLIAIRVLEVM